MACEYIRIQDLLAIRADWDNANPNDWDFCSGSVSDVGRWMQDFCDNNNLTRVYGPEIDDYTLQNVIWQSIKAFDPKVSRANGADQIAIYCTAKERHIPKRVAMKPGKAFRRILGNLPDLIVDKMVDGFKRKFDSAGYEVIWGSERSDFKTAYLGSNYAPMENITFSGFRKSLANSCMRYSFGDGIHPAEFFASGDFRIIYVKRKDTGAICARSVCRVDSDRTPGKEIVSFAPIYGTNDNAINLIESEYEKRGAVCADEGDYWQGVRYLYIPMGSDSAYATYQDCGPCSAFLSDCGKYLIADYGSPINLCSTSGFVQIEGRCKCCQCMESLDDDCQTDDNGNNYCDDCYSDRFGYCESCEETFDRDEFTLAYSAGRYSPNESYVCPNCLRRHYTECTEGRDSGDYWKDDETYETNDGETISVRDYEDSYFTSDFSGQIFDYSERVETDSGESWTESECEDEGYSLWSDGVWHEGEESDDDCDLINPPLAHCDPDPDQPALPLPCMAESFPVCTVAQSGLTDFAAIQSQTLSKYPAIGTLIKSDGTQWFYFTTNVCSNAYWTMTDFEYPSLGGCVLAYCAKV